LVTHIRTALVHNDFPQVTLPQITGASTPAMVFNAREQALTIEVSVKSTPCLFCLEIFRESDLKPDPAGEILMF
jgi:hypothetical protein